MIEIFECLNQDYSRLWLQNHILNTWKNMKYTENINYMHLLKRFKSLVTTKNKCHFFTSMKKNSVCNVCIIIIYFTKVIIQTKNSSEISTVEWIPVIWGDDV